MPTFHVGTLQTWVCRLDGRQQAKQTHLPHGVSVVGAVPLALHALHHAGNFFLPRGVEPVFTVGTLDRLATCSSCYGLFTPRARHRNQSHRIILEDDPYFSPLASLISSSKLTFSFSSFFKSISKKRASIFTRLSL